MWEADPGAMAASLELHDRICREAVSRHGGYVFSTAGDAFAVAFSSPAGSVAAATEIQRSLASTPWPGPSIAVRIGIHSGTAAERDGDYFGPAVNRAARIMSAGRGGQVLVSEVTAELVRKGHGVGLAFVDRGRFHLAGIDSPERIFEVQVPGATPVVGDLRARRVVLTNLPQPLSTFVGRDRELGAIEERTAASRLVVLTGPGGTGKTRLAIEAGHRLLDSYSDGVWIAELAPVVDPDQVMTAIGDVFGLRPGEGAGIDDVVVRHLGDRNVLLIVDNCEHVLNGAIASIRRILAAAPGVVVLATSRESLGIDGEATVTVPSLSIPDGSGKDLPESVRLFLDRAGASGWTPAPGDRDAVDRICRRVDGIPLGLELAAARLRTLTPGELADRLEQSFDVLGGRAKSTLPRHRTLAATIDWSYQLLTADERTVFRTVAVFVGGFDVAAAEAVVTIDGVIDLIDSLVDKSLLVPLRQPESVRFRMLEPVRQFAIRLLESDGELDQAASAHASHFCSRVAAESPATRGPDQVAAMRRLDLELDDIRVALRTLLASGRGDEYLTMAFDLFAYWVHRGLHLEAIGVCLRGLQSPASPPLRIRAWFVAAILGAEVTSPVGIDHARSGLAEAVGLGDDTSVGWMEVALGAAIRHATSDPEYLQHLVAGREILDGRSPSWWEPPWEDAFRNLVLAAYLPGTDPRVGEHEEATVTMFERIGDRAMYGAALMETAISVGADLDHMVARLRQSVDVFEEVPSVQWQAHARMNLGSLLRMRGDVDEGAVHLSEASEQLDDLGDLFCWANATRWLAHCQLVLGYVDEPRARLLEVIDRFDLLPMPEIATPRTVDLLVATLVADGHWERAALTLGCAETVPFDVPTVIPRTLEEARLRIEQAIGVDACDRLRAEGSEIPPRVLLDEARAWLGN